MQVACTFIIYLDYAEKPGVRTNSWNVSIDVRGSIKDCSVFRFLVSMSGPFPKDTERCMRFIREFIEQQYIKLRIIRCHTSWWEIGLAISSCHVVLYRATIDFKSEYDRSFPPWNASTNSRSPCGVPSSKGSPITIWPGKPIRSKCAPQTLLTRTV